VEWDKGAAILFLLKALHLDVPQVLPIFLGDDETDEDAFRVLIKRGWGILVDPEPSKSSARAFLRSTSEVRLFLQRLLHRLS
jgi:alpha,alpha-trehalase